MVAKLNRKQTVVIWILLLLLFLPYLYVTQFAHPIADDFGYTHKLWNRGFWKSQILDYLNWNGRYFSNILVYSNPLVWKSLLGYRIIPVLLIIGTVSSIYAFVRTLFSDFSKTNSLLISLIVSQLFMHQSPTVVEAFYWYTGSVTYQLANILCLFYLSLLIKLINRKNRIYSIIASLLLIATIGCNEVIMLIFLAFHLTLLYLNYRKNKKINSTILGFTILTIICSCIIIFAPGNSGRTSNFNPELIHNPLISIRGTFFQTIQFLGYWFLDIALLLFSLIFLIMLPKLKRNYFIKNSFFLKPWQAVASIFVIMVCCIFPCYWNTGIIGQHRTMITAYWIFLIIWFVNLTVWGNYLSKHPLLLKLQTNSKQTFIVVLASVISMGLIKNGLSINIDALTGRANEFDTEMKNRYTIIEQSKALKKSNAYLPPIKTTDCTLFIWDIKQNNKHWMNTGYCQYFAIDNVYLKNE